MEFPVEQYKALIRSTVPLAKSRGDLNDYSRTSFSAVGANERITATRYSHLKKYASPLSPLVGRCRCATIGILEEISDSQP